MANLLLGRFAKRLSISTGSTSTTQSTKRTSKEEISEVTSRSSNDHVGASSSSSSVKINKKFQWVKKMFTKKVSPQNTETQLENTNHEWINSSDSSLAIVDEIVFPEYVATGSTHSYISSSDDECVGRIITLPVFSVTQSITDVHNTCILEWDPDHCAEREECKDSTAHN